MVTQMWEGVARMTALARDTTHSLLDGSALLGGAGPACAAFGLQVPVLGAGSCFWAQPHPSVCRAVVCLLRSRDMPFGRSAACAGHGVASLLRQSCR